MGVVGELTPWMVARQLRAAGHDLGPDAGSGALLVLWAAADQVVVGFDRRPMPAGAGVRLAAVRATLVGLGYRVTTVRRSGLTTHLYVHRPARMVWPVSDGLTLGALVGLTECGSPGVRCDDPDPRTPGDHPTVESTRTDDE